MDKHKRVKAELSYNPYLMETEIKFNGREPRINSRVEKFYNSNLQDWVNEIPEIFYEEMNGYDFDLNFIGTDLDYYELSKAFEHAGVSSEKVIINHMETLGERPEKIRSVKDLLKWIKDSQNEYFNYEQFSEDNVELLEGTYPLKVLQDDNIGLPILNLEGVSVERIKGTDELIETDLVHVPIVVLIGDDNIVNIQSIAEFLKNRNDVADNQVFFLIDSKLDLDIVKRTLVDLGFEKPQIVDAIDSESIRKYYELYPQIDYINSAICILRKEADLIEGQLDKDNEIKKEEYSDTQIVISELENRISKLKESDNYIVKRNVLDDPSVFIQKKIELYEKIVNWRKKKTKITSEGEAVTLSVELSKEASFGYDDFSKAVRTIENEMLDNISNRLNEMYLSAEYDQGFIPEGIVAEEFRIVHTPRIEQDLQQIKEYSPVMKKDQGLFFMPKSSNDSFEMDMETIYYIQKWREYALSVVETMADSLIESRIDALQ